MSIKQSIKERIGKEILFFDGGMGSMLQQAGMSAGELPEEWVMERPEVIKDIHRSYLESGCQIMTTCTFGANPVRLDSDRYTTEDIAVQAIRLAREAIQESGKEAFVALDTGTTGKLLQPLGDLSFEQAYEAYHRLFSAGASLADLIIIETMTDLHEMKAAVLAAKDATDLPVFASAIIDASGKMMTGGNTDALVTLLEGLGVDALGLNCGFGPSQMLPYTRSILDQSHLPVLIMPNAGLPRNVNGTTVYDLDPVSYADEMEKIAALGPQIIGGCCGTTPAHMAELIRRLKGHPASLPDVPVRTRASSYTHAVEIGHPSTIIGEKINPTGNKPLAEALRAEDMDYISQLAVREVEAGAQILDVNVGLPDIDEPDLLPRVIQTVQAVVDVPLVIDCSDPVALERAARIYNGKPIINSVNAKPDSMKAVFPIAAKYGCTLIGLALGEGGIPSSVEGRLDVARTLIREAATYGIRREDLIIDALALTISTSTKAAGITLQTLEALRSQCHVHTILGVSNISFGLPQREKINTAFYAMALNRGLSSAIINPFSQAMMDTAMASRALTDQDENCAGYIASRAASEPQSPSATDKPPEQESNPSEMLQQAIIDGLKNSTRKAVSALLETTDPLDIINRNIIPALTTVGDQFESGESFLPQLVMSAEAASLAFEEIKKKLPAESSGEKGRVILATVEGDIHDIGKNIVKTLLESYGFDVLDLGKDVPVAEVVKAAKENHIKLIGLSALLTTAVPNMEKTISELKKALPDCRICVGGAVMTEAYAASIHADHYCDDAMDTVHRAQEFYDNK